MKAHNILILTAVVGGLILLAFPFATAKAAVKDSVQDHPEFSYEAYNPDFLAKLDSRVVKKPLRSTKFYGEELCFTEDYFCFKVKKGDTWKKLFSTEEDINLVKRLNRINQPVTRRPWLLVPYNFAYDIKEYSPLPSEIDTKHEKLIMIDLSDHAFGAYINGKLAKWGPVSAGKSSTQTVRGDFSIKRKQGEYCKSSKYPQPNGGAKMPYCMHFYRGFAMHGQVVPGYHASHGCVRLFDDDAKWLNHDFADIHTPVKVIN